MTALRVTALRVMVFDEAASIRGLLSREIGSASGLVCVGSFPTSTLLEDSLDLGGADALVVGLAQDDQDRFSEIVARLDMSELPSIVISSRERSNSVTDHPLQQRLTLEKPRSPQGWGVLCSVLVTVLVRAEGGSTTEEGPAESTIQSNRERTSVDLVAVGASAGGPEATGTMLAAIGDALKHTAIIVVQHIGPSFESEYVQWLRSLIPWVDVDIAEDGEAVQSGRVRIAGPGSHLEVSEGHTLRLDRENPATHGHRPSVDRLFKSIARRKPENSAGILLSGMGIDGVEGLLNLREAGCLTMVQDSSSSSVFGMPGAALERGAATISHSPEDLGMVLKSIIDLGKGR